MRQGVIHRNFKQEHILIDKDGCTIFCGFGKSEEFQSDTVQPIASRNPSPGGAL